MDARDSAFRNRLREMVSGGVLTDEPMALHTSMRAGGRADIVAFPAGRVELAGLITFLKACGVPYTALGNGTNLIVRDGGYRGVVICLQKLKGISLSGSGEERTMAALAGTPLREMVSRAAQEGLSGLEFCAGIPGSLGGALRMNAGAYGREMKDVVIRLELLNSAGEVKNIEREDLIFSYRNLELPAGALIVDGEFVLRVSSREAVEKEVRRILDLRGAKHPLNFPNSGSIFKNPAGAPAGRLIEQCGLKGLRVGGAAVSELHGNFIVNLGNAEAADIIELIGMITESVREKTGVSLETEVRIIGEDR